MPPQPKDPLHGMTLEKILRIMVEEYGWDQLARLVPVRCFMFDPTITSSLRFLRQTSWARAKLESLYCDHVRCGEPE